jgi:hypothetical protein
MERFYEILKSMEPPGKVQKLEQIIHFLRSNNAHQHADAFLELKNCYLATLLFKNEREFRVYLAWCCIYGLPHHPAFAHVLTQT